MVYSVSHLHGIEVSHHHPGLHLDLGTPFVVFWKVGTPELRLKVVLLFHLYRCVWPPFSGSTPFNSFGVPGSDRLSPGESLALLFFHPGGVLFPSPRGGIRFFFFYLIWCLPVRKDSWNSWAGPSSLADGNLSLRLGVMQRLGAEILGLGGILLLVGGRLTLLRRFWGAHS